jgi:hypothetical protein
LLMKSSAAGLRPTTGSIAVRGMNHSSVFSAARGQFVPVAAQHGEFGEHLARLAHAHAGFLAVFFAEYAHGTGADDVQAIGRIARLADGVAERIVARLDGGRQFIQFLRREDRQDLDGGQEFRGGLLLLRQ